MKKFNKNVGTILAILREEEEGRHWERHSEALSLKRKLGKETLGKAPLCLKPLLVKSYQTHVFVLGNQILFVDCDPELVKGRTLARLVAKACGVPLGDVTEVLDPG
jgi:hypothetical protein